LRRDCELHRSGVICYDPEQQRGWRITYRDGVEHRRQYVIKPSKVKEIAQAIAENREYNRVRTVNARIGHVGLAFEPYGEDARLGRLHIFRLNTDDGIDGLLTIPDSAHRQEGDKWFAERIARGKHQSFSPEHAGFTPATYDVILIITLTDKQGEGESHYEHNELITKSSSTRRAFLEGGEISLPNWIVHELMRLNQTTRELVEVYENSISGNSPKIITFSTLAKGIEEGWSAWSSQSTKGSSRDRLMRRYEWRVKKYRNGTFSHLPGDASNDRPLFTRRRLSSVRCFVSSGSGTLSTSTTALRTTGSAGDRSCAV
jgi:hypothetical protein